MLSAEPTSGRSCLLPVRDYDLAVTLDSGQAFRWKPQGTAWAGIVGCRWVRLEQTTRGILAETASDPSDWQWLKDYLQTGVDLGRVLEALPKDPPLVEALHAHPGLRLLRQDPWECLASFILSSTKQIVHIKQIVERLCRRHGSPLETPAGEPGAHAFPGPEQVASLEESTLRSLSMGFRAAYLLETARRIASGRLHLEALKAQPLGAARAALMELPGVGRKIADCVLLFALGFEEAFPVDVWVMRILRESWFPGQAPSLPHLVRFAEQHFGRYGGYAQQYLFHHARTQTLRINSPNSHDDQG